MKFNKRLTTAFAAMIILCCANLLSAAKKPAPTSFEALVVKVDGSSLVLNAVEEKHFKRTTVQTDDKTQVILNGTAGTLGELQPGQRVIISPPRGTARQIEQKPPRTRKPPESGLLDAALISATPGQIIFYSPQANGEISEMHAAPSDKTLILIDGKPASLSDLKPAQPLLLAFTGGTLRRIVVQPQPPD